MPVQPAWVVPLSQRELALLGKLVALLGQIEAEMIECVSNLLESRETAEIVMGSTRMADKSAVWAALVKDRTANKRLRRWVDHAVEEIATLSRDRNDLVHAHWDISVLLDGIDPPYLRITSYGWPLMKSKFKFGTPRARRTQNQEKRRFATDLPAVVDRAARLTCVIAHITERMDENKRDGPSTWRRKLGPAPQPRPAKASVRRAKGQRSPPQSSEA